MVKSRYKARKEQSKIRKLEKFVYKPVSYTHLAGRSRWKGIRPTVRGSVMNPNDHPHGGGEGKAPVGRKAPSTPWGKPALGLKTRNKKAKSDKLIVRRRNEK